MPDQTTAEKSYQERPWALVFIEIALRAVRRVHYEYGRWGIGRPWRMDAEKSRRINMGAGVELADELTVCAAITQEFIGSPSVAGRWVEAGNPTEWYFQIDREQRWYTKNPKEKVDIFIRKYVADDGGELAEKDFPVFMEAKRARLWYPDLTLGTARPDPNLRVGSVQSDVSKLRDERSQRKKDVKEDINCQLIVWGIYETDSSQDDPYQFFRDVGNGVLMHQLRWLPLKWQCPSAADIRASKVLLPVVERALWIALAEVDPPTS